MLSVLAEYLYSTQMVNPILAEHIYMMSELCVRYKKIFIYQFNIFQLKS